MTEPVPTTGFLDKPVFARGGPPDVKAYRPPPRPSKWQPHFELGRLYAAWPDGRKPPPGYEVDPKRGWMIVSRVTRGGKATMRSIINHDRTEITVWLDRNCPLERWQFSVRIITDTWSQRELYMRFLGTLTEEEDALDRKERKAYWEARQAKIVDNRAKRQLEARLKARAEEEASRAKSRRRG